MQFEAQTPTGLRPDIPRIRAWYGWGGGEKQNMTPVAGLRRGASTGVQRDGHERLLQRRGNLHRECPAREGCLPLRGGRQLRSSGRLHGHKHRHYHGYGGPGLSPGTQVVGIVPGDVTGTIYIDPDVEAVQAILALTNAYSDAASRTGDTIGSALGGVLLPGVYDGRALGLTGILSLTSDEDDVWMSQTASTLDTAGSSQVVLKGGARAANIY